MKGLSVMTNNVEGWELVKEVEACRGPYSHITHVHFLLLFSFFSLAGSRYNGLMLSFIFPTYGTLLFIGGMHVIPEVNNWWKGKKATLHILNSSLGTRSFVPYLRGNVSAELLVTTDG
jgi:hypothetical protein